MSDIKRFTKAPYELLDFTADYTAEMAAIGSTISSSLWIVPSDTVDDAGNTSIDFADGITVDEDIDNPSPAYSLGGTVTTNDKATIFLSGGTKGQVYRVKNRIITANGRRYSRIFDVEIKDKSC